jgi:hypothetical protein
VDAEEWIKEHRDRLREQMSDWPAWMKTRMKPPRVSAQGRRDARKASKKLGEKHIKRA